MSKYQFVEEFNDMMGVDIWERLYDCKIFFDAEGMWTWDGEEAEQKAVQMSFGEDGKFCWQKNNQHLRYEDAVKLKDQEMEVVQAGFAANANRTEEEDEGSASDVDMGDSEGEPVNMDYVGGEDGGINMDDGGGGDGGFTMDPADGNADDWNGDGSEAQPRGIRFGAHTEALLAKKAPSSSAPAVIRSGNTTPSTTLPTSAPAVGEPSMTSTTLSGAGESGMTTSAPSTSAPVPSSTTSTTLPTSAPVLEEATTRKATPSPLAPVMEEPGTTSTTLSPSAPAVEEAALILEEAALVLESARTIRKDIVALVGRAEVLKSDIEALMESRAMQEDRLDALLDKTKEWRAALQKADATSTEQDRENERLREEVRRYKAMAEVMKKSMDEGLLASKEIYMALARHSGLARTIGREETEGSASTPLKAWTPAQNQVFGDSVDAVTTLLTEWSHEQKRGLRKAYNIDPTLGGGFNTLYKFGAEEPSAKGST